MNKEEEIMSPQIEVKKFFVAHPVYYIVPIVIFIISIVLIIIFKLEPMFVYFALFIPLAILIVIYSIVYNKARGKMMQQFAVSLGFSYAPLGDMASVDGALFSNRRSAKIKDVISGISDEHEVRIFIYTYIAGSGKESHTEYCTVFEKTFHSDFPHIILIYNIIPFIKETYLPFSGVNYVALEGDFNKHFSLHVEREYEIEALQIFTPDFMQELMDTAKGFSFEFYKNKLYIYKRMLITERKDLDTMFSVADKIFRRIEPSANSISGDMEAMNEAFNKK